MARAAGGPRRGASVVLAGAFAGAFAPGALRAEEATQVDRPHSTLVFGSGLPRPAPLWGAPKKGAHVTMMKLPAGFSSPLHTHERDIKGVVVKGTVRHWLEGQTGTAALAPGSAWFTPGRLRHHTACLGPEDCQFLVIQDGAFDVRLPPAAPAEAAWHPVFADEFQARLGDGWSWLRPVPAATRLPGRGLELRVLPGNIVFDWKTGQNVLLRPLPPTDAPVGASVEVSVDPEAEYEQAGFALFADESNYVKLVVERYQGRRVANLVREDRDQVAIIASSAPLEGPVELRLTLVDDTVTAQVRPRGGADWRFVGACLVTATRPTQVALFAFMGKEAERWARFERLRVLTAGPGSAREPRVP